MNPQKEVDAVGRLGINCIDLTTGDAGRNTLEGKSAEECVIVDELAYIEEDNNNYNGSDIPCNVLVGEFVFPPHHLSEILTDFMVQRNTGNGPCLFKSAVQHISSVTGIDISYTDLRIKMNQILIDNWKEFQCSYVFPREVTIGGNKGFFQRIINTEEDYLKFLTSKDNLESFNDTNAELILLSAMLNVNVHVCSYNLPVGQGINGQRYSWLTINPKENTISLIPENSMLDCKNEPLYLLYEDKVHYERMVKIGDYDGYSLVTVNIPTGKEDYFTYPNSQCIEGNRNVDNESSCNTSDIDRGIDDVVENVLSLTSEPDSLVKENAEIDFMDEFHADKLTTEVETGPIQPCLEDNFRTRGSSVCIEGAGIQSTSSDACDHVCDGVVRMDDSDDHDPCINSVLELDVKKNISNMVDSQKCSQVTTFNNSIRKSSTEENKIQREEESFQGFSTHMVLSMFQDINKKPLKASYEKYFKFPIKDLSVDEILAPSDPADIIKEAELDAWDEKIRNEKEIREREISKLNNDIAEEKSRQNERRERYKKNKERRNLMEAKLSSKGMQELFKNNEEYIKKIYNGQVYSYRRDQYMRGGFHRQNLNVIAFVPFSEMHLDILREEVSKLWLSSYDDFVKNSDFIWKVILPEAFIKVYNIDILVMLFMYTFEDLHGLFLYWKNGSRIQNFSDSSPLL